MTITDDYIDKIGDVFLMALWNYAPEKSWTLYLPVAGLEQTGRILSTVNVGNEIKRRLVLDRLMKLSEEVLQRIEDRKL